MNKKIHLVVFSLQELLFGIYAEQVEELLDQEEFQTPEIIEPEYSLSYQGQDIRVIDFSMWLRLRNKKKSVQEGKHSFSSSRILIIKQRYNGYMGVRIEQLEGLVSVALHQIHALPVLMQKTRCIEGLWGIAVVGDHSVILLDPTRL